MQAGNLFRIKVVVVKSQPVSGEMDYGDLRLRLAENTENPAIVSINIGTTVKGAVDSLAEVQAALAVRTGPPPAQPACLPDLSVVGPCAGGAPDWRSSASVSRPY